MACGKITVMVFYSSLTEPAILPFYSEGIEYLKNHDVVVEIVDVAKKPDLAKRNKILLTPLLLIKKDGGQERYVGVVEGFKDVLVNAVEVSDG